MPSARPKSDFHQRAMATENRDGANPSPHDGKNPTSGIREMGFLDFIVIGLNSLPLAAQKLLKQFNA
jgi:hypothetical protein